MLDRTPEPEGKPKPFKAAPVVEPEPDVGVPEALPVEITEFEPATKKLFFPAKGGTDMGFKISGLSELYALEAALDAAPWGASSDSDPALMRDDNVATAWLCKREAQKRCAIAVHLSEDASLAAVRLYAPRVKRLRVHTREGFVDVELPEAQTHTYALLGQRVRTRYVGVEVLEAWGAAKKPIEVAEIEVYGDAGTARAGLDIDPARAYVVHERDPWRKRGEEYEASPAFIELVDAAGGTTRFAHGTALVGRRGDRFLLIERITAARCGSATATFFLLDTHTRMVAPLGALSGGGSSVFRHQGGTGLALGYADDRTSELSGVVLADDATYVRKKTPARQDRRSADTFAAWGFDREPLLRGGMPVEDACTPVKVSEPGRRVWRCSLASKHVAQLSDDTRCGKTWNIEVVGPDGASVATASGKGRGSHLWVSKIEPGELLVEAALDGRPSQVFRLTESGIQALEGTALALRVPPPCRSSCQVRFLNPGAPEY